RPFDHVLEIAREGNRDRLGYRDPDLPAALRGRTADNWRHLFAIAETAGGAWPERVKLAAEALTAKDAGQTAAVLLLEDMRGLFANGDKIASQEVARILGAREDRPWSEWKSGKPITPRQLARLLEGFGIAPSTIRTSAGTAKGYRAEQFADTFSRWLPPILSVTPSQPAATNGSSGFRSVTTDSNVTDRNVPKATDTNTCDGVTDENPQGWEKGL
ncbi:MAG: DUF3631 domain-containing protein, partial [Alphaproteobacteria bacterium]|nr:DUF3631 domain-containing protein [Alphaproteobacteria bacterium]